jgi:hypothetical protein
MTPGWHLTLPGLVILVLMAAMLVVGIHMIVRPQVYVGRGPLPAQGPANVRAMGVLFVILGGSITAFFTAPIFFLS